MNAHEETFYLAEFDRVKERLAGHGATWSEDDKMFIVRGSDGTIDGFKINERGLFQCVSLSDSGEDWDEAEFADPLDAIERLNHVFT